MEREETQILTEAKCDATDLCEESVESTGARNAIEQDINTLDKQIALLNKRYSENVDKQQNDVSHSAAKDGESTERTKRRRHRRAGAQNVMDQQDQENLVKTDPRKNLESLPERKHNAEYAISLYRGRGATNSDTCGRGYMRGINRSRGQSFNSNKKRGSTYDGDKGRRGSHFNRGGRTSDDRGRGRPDFNRGRGISDNRGRGRADFNGGRGISDDRGRETSEFNSDRGRPSFNRGHGRSEELFPNMFKLLKIFASLPVTIATAKRTFSTLRRLKTYPRNACGQDRLSGLGSHIFPPKP
ncbi:hypothetical protein QYM36_015266 [Artemia franciscana]|uniref:HAT C-terminal dimerisation domain-containing protein n=1 Tax=Artemia franciscana TaxID=6661 RepID=A0AA88KX77_ARTSF|nr:hypothetical protein QYM36_015266 [Artemia franciscana]